MKFITAMIIATLAPLAGLAKTDLDVSNTHAVIAGVLRWQDNALSPFSDRHRKDQELHDVLIKRGVPKENLRLLLDKEATLANVRDALTKIAKQAKPKSTLIFYYAGHGTKSGGRISFCPFDYRSGGEIRGLTMTDVGDLIAKHFKGERVFLLADCCYSGGLKLVAKRLSKAGFKAASVTSADESNVSCVNWSFTQTMIDALLGDPLIDADGNGVITWKEVDQEVGVEMKYRERQRHGGSSFGIANSFRLSETSGKAKLPAIKGPLKLKEYVWVTDGGRRRVGRIVGVKDDKLAVELYDYSDKRIVHPAVSQLQKITFRSYKVGDKVQVRWQGKPFPAKVVRVDNDFHLITYEGYDSSWDEWVLEDRIVDPELAKKPKAEVEWKGKWYPAVVLKQKDAKYLIHYDNFDSSWDEWVGKNRIRFPKKPK